MRIAYLAALGGLCLAGCATNIKVDYVSDPPAAVLYEDGAPKGTTPFTLFYQPDASFKSGGCMNTRPMSVKWASGATAGISYLTLCANKGMVQHYVFSRPDVPGRDTDLNYALEVERNRIMRAQAAAAIMQATTPPPQPIRVYTPPQTIHCTSSTFGGTTTTNCH